MCSLPDDTCESWVVRLAALPVPVLRATQSQIAYLNADHDRADAHGIAEVVLRDPLMCLRVLVEISQRLGEKLATPVESVTAALVLGGIEPFFRQFSDTVAIEERLQSEPRALAGALALVERSHRAARLAAAFAIHRQDEDAELLHQAALLHDFAGLLLWCDSPLLSLEMAVRQARDSTLRSATVQRIVLGAEVGTIAQRLMECWGLPQALCALVQPGPQPVTAGQRTVALAVQLARHLETGWHNEALPDDFAEIGALLNAPPHAAAALARDVLG